MALDREKTLAAAQQFTERNQFDRALEEYRKLLAADPNDARILLKVGDLQMRAEDFASAIATYDRVARFYADQGFALKAVAVYKQVRELLTNHRPDLQPSFGHVLDHLVQLYLSLGLPNDALQTLDEEATRLRRLNYEEAAVDIYRRMTAVSAGAPLPHLRLAEGLCRIGRVEEALTSFWTASQLLLQADRKDDALRVVERMLHFKSEPRYALAAAKLYLDKGTAPEGMQALSRLQVCFQADPSNLEVLGLLADAFAVIGQTDKATEVQKEIARQAHEQGDAELFTRTLQALKHNAPDDPQVEALTQMPPPRGSSRPAASRSSLGAPPPKPRASSPGNAPPPQKPAAIKVQVPDLPESFYRQSQVPGAPTSASLAPLAATSIPAPSAPLSAAPESAEPESLAAFSQAPMPPVSSRTSQPPVPPLPPLGSQISQGTQPLPPPPPLSAPGPASASLPPLPFPPPTSAPPSAPDRVSRLSREIAEATLSTVPHPTRSALRSEIDVDDLDDLDFVDEESMSGGPLSNSVPRPAQARTGTPTGIDLQAHSRQVLQQVQQHRLQGQIHRAIESLQLALEVNARSIELREMLRDLYAELGDREGAIEEMLTMSAIYLEYGRPDHAETVLRNILEAEPEHARAVHALAGISSYAGMSAPQPRARRSNVLPPPPLPGTTPAPPRPTASAAEELFIAASVEEALEEADFFSSRGMFADARRVILDQLASTPGHPLLLETLGEYERHQQKNRSTPPPAARRPSDFNIKAQLSELERVVRESQNPPAGPIASVSIDVDEVFEKFKQGVRAQVADSDSATHYDLGLAYKEMNLLDDAIEELKLAARDPERECNCHAMIGMIYADQKMWDPARKFYSKGLGAMKRTPAQEVTLYYELGNVSEMAEQMDQAAYYFRQVLRRDSNFRDARERLAKLRTSWAPPAESRSSGSHDEEVDRAFDELMNDG